MHLQNSVNDRLDAASGYARAFGAASRAALQLGQDRRSRIAQTRKVIAAFKQECDSPLGEFFRQIDQTPGHRPKSLLRDFHAAERVALVRDEIFPPHRPRRLERFVNTPCSRSPPAEAR